MNCFPFVKQLFKFGRKISKMALKTTKYNALSSPKNSYYIRAQLDSEIDNHLTGSYTSSSTSGFMSSKMSAASFDNFSKFENKRGSDKSDLSSCFDSFDLDEKSTAFAKHWKVPESSFDWTNSKQFIDFGNFVQSSSHGFSDCSLFSYSPLSSLESISNDQSYNDLYSDDLCYRIQQESIRREFEMNGKNVEYETFCPLTMSTPFVERKSDHHKFNHSNNLESTKVESKPTEFMPPNELEEAFSCLPFQPYKNDKENIQFDSIYPPPYLIPTVPHDNKADNKINERKRGHQNQPHEVLPNQFQMINTNNSNYNFEAANKKKMDKKNSIKKKKMDDHCVFCKNNGADEILYKSHTVKDLKGRVLCPKLRLYKCPICGADGDQSHTVRYCPKKPIVTMEDLKKQDASKKTNGYASTRFY